ncbi:MAG TPA: hypothetical protein VJH55_03555 [Candidatus Paceibacterota bacterium]
MGKDKGYKKMKPTNLFYTSDIGFFPEDGKILFIFKKTERFVAALYLVTNLFSEHESLKWTLREEGTWLLKAVVYTVQSSKEPGRLILTNIIAHLLSLRSLIDISFSAGLISGMNFSILVEELEMLLCAAREAETEVGLDNHGTFGAHFFHLETEQPSQLRKQSNERTSTGNIKDNTTSIKDISSTAYSRRETVIKLLKNKPHLTIKDFSVVINNCSEKTIQRELLRLVSEGVLKKEGERRWSTYSLALF